ncbi:unnamed protein product [Meganyctiphanes norvegica]|uniref:FYVE-type domain-containing protein n=1 Tax=Meganyctiphanes norvegica TaxID=48144 RepID=A0AAV2SKA9_MEGNR
MEKFAVDLDKVLDDFELGEDENECVSQYDKLQLEFEGDSNRSSVGGAASQLGPTSHQNVGLGAYGGWSGPIHTQQYPGTPTEGPSSSLGLLSEQISSSVTHQNWCGLDLPSSHPPGTRSPPDGQNDDSKFSHSPMISSSQPTFNLHQRTSSGQGQVYSQYRQSQSSIPAQSLPGATLRINTATAPDDSQQEPTIWPGISTVTENSLNFDFPPSSGTSHLSILSRESRQAFQPSEISSGDTPSLGGPLLPQEIMVDPTHNSDRSEDPNAMVDLTASQSLDIVPQDIPFDPSDCGGHNSIRHPDLIDVWQSGSSHSGAISGAGNKDESTENCRQVNEALGSTLVSEEQPNHSIEEQSQAVAAAQESRLLPDLMSGNSFDSIGGRDRSEANLHHEDLIYRVDYPEPAIVMENTLSDNLYFNQGPAIVMESQESCRIPEVVNVHQTAEFEHRHEGNSNYISDFHASNEGNINVRLEEVPRKANASVSQEQYRSVNTISNYPENQNVHQEIENGDNNTMNSASGNSINIERTNINSQALATSSVGALPDVSVVNPGIPISFNDIDISEADLDAELAELEEEQARLAGAYGGARLQAETLNIDASKPEFRSGNNSQIPNLSGPDLIGSLSHPGPDMLPANLHAIPRSNDESKKNLENEDITVKVGEMPTTNDSSEDIVPKLESQTNMLDTNQAYKLVSVECTSSGAHLQPVPGKSLESEDQPDNNCQLSQDVIDNKYDKEWEGNMPEGNVDGVILGDGIDNISCNSTDTSSSTLTEGETAHMDQLGSNPTQTESPTRNTPGTLVTAVYDDDSGSGREDEGSGAVAIAREGQVVVTGNNTTSNSEEASNTSMVGKVAPFWIPDEDAPNCQECHLKFTVIRRRHHCRACGRVLCAQCCHSKAKLPYMDFKEARVCQSCLEILQADETAMSEEDPSSAVENRVRNPDPNNPMDYCSRVPPAQQVSAGQPPPTVMVPVGVLKREGGCNTGSRTTRVSKQVIFSDGIRPGGDLTELDGSTEPPPPPPPFRRGGRVARKPDKPITEYMFEDGPKSQNLEEQLKGDGPPVVFAIQKNLSVLVKIVKLECCVGVEVWNMATRGLCTVGQEELVVLLEVAPGEIKPPKCLFSYFTTVYQQANQGNLVTELGHTIFTEPEGFLGSRDHGGFLYIRPTFQCLHNLVLPPSPYIFALLIQKWETPWAKLFPLRLMLRMGAEFRYYPCPLVSIRNRKPVFCEIGHTIMNLLVDFRNYAYTVPVVEGLHIHMEDKKTTLSFPKNRYEQVSSALSNSNDHVLAFGGNFSPQADSHLVTIENDDGHYTTQAINIHNRPRRVTGASFIVFNGALKTTSGLLAKSSIVEDGLMVQIPGDMMTALRDALSNMRDFDIHCGPTHSLTPDEKVLIRWVQDDKNFNIGIKSPVDERQMDGVPSVKIHSGTDYISNAYLIRWTEVFIIQGDTNNSGDVNLSGLSEVLSRAFCVGLTPHLAELYGAQQRLGLRTTLHQDSVGYEAGSGGCRLPQACMNQLDTELIPVIHRAAANITDQPIILELIFYILEQ